MIFRVGSEPHLLEDSSDVILEEAVKAPSHLQRSSQDSERSSKVAVVFGVAQIKLHIGTGLKALQE